MTMEKVTKNSEMSAQQSVEFVNDLKRTNRCVLFYVIIIAPFHNLYSLIYDYSI